MDRATAQNVAAICDQLVAGGAATAITSRQVRDELGFGSFTTIVKYIRAWKLHATPIVVGTPPSAPTATMPNLDAVSRGVQLPSAAAALAADADEVHSRDQLEFDLVRERKTEQRPEVEPMRGVQYYLDNLQNNGTFQRS